MALTNGTSGPDEICAIPDQNNNLFGGSGDDTLVAWNGGTSSLANQFDGGGGNDRFVFSENSLGMITGGDGIDTLVLPIARTEARITELFEPTLLISIDSLVGDFGVRSSRVEFYEFTDGTVAYADFLSSPVAGDDTGSIDADNVFAVDASVLLANDTDSGNTGLYLEAVDGSGSLGTVSLDGSLVTYDPGTAFDSLGAGESATDTFTYTLTNLGFNEDTATVTITVFGVNDDPTATDDVAAGDEDTPVVLFASDLLANDTDPDTGDTLTVTAVDGSGTTGTVVLSGTTITYDPNGQFEALSAGESATDTFTYTVSDGNGGTDTATVTVTISGVDDNQAPVAVDDSAAAAFETSVLIDVLSNDTDADGDTLSIDGIAFPPNNGSAAIENGQIRYTPSAGFSGTDTVTYGVTDGMGGSDTAVVTVTVAGQANAAPVAVDDIVNIETSNSVLIDVLANDSDADGDTLSIISVTQATNGVASIIGDAIRYDPDQALNETDQFSYTIIDSNGDSDTATVFVLSSLPEALPLGRDDFVVFPPQSGGTQAAAVQSLDAGGGAEIRTAEFEEFDTFDFNISASYGFDFSTTQVTVNPIDSSYGTSSYDRNTQTISWEVGGGYNGPALIEYRYFDESTPEDFEIGRVGFIGWDLSQPTVSPLDAQFTVGAAFSFASNGATAQSTSTGGDFLSFLGVDFSGDEEQARLDREGVEPPDFSVNGMTIAELANGDLIEVLAAAVNDDGFLTFDLEIGGEMVYAIDLDQDVDSIDAVPDDTSSFLYRVRDPEGNSSVGVFSIEVGTDLTPNEAPVANEDMASAAVDQSVVIDVTENDTDGDGDSLTIDFIVADPGNGTAEVTNNQITYTPNAGFSGTDSFVYAVEDGQGGLAVGAVEVTVGADPDQPVAVADAASTDQFVPVEIPVLSNDSDPNGDALSITEVTRPSRGVVAINEDGTLSYVPRRGFTGEDSFTYTLSDGQGGSAAAEVNVAVNDLPEDVVTARVVAYLYEAALGRFPDLGGVNFWINVVNSGGFTLTEMASAFLGSREFTDRFGAVDTLSDRQLIDQLYLNVLDRPGEAGGVAFWEGQLGLPTVSREDMLLSFAESAENQLGSPQIVTLVETAEDQWDFVG